MIKANLLDEIPQRFKKTQTLSDYRHGGALATGNDESITFCQLFPRADLYKFEGLIRMELGSCSSEKREVLSNATLKGEDANRDCRHLLTECEELLSRLCLYLSIAY